MFLMMLENNEERTQFSQFYNKYEKVFLRYALQITKNQAMAEDAIHDAFVSILSNKKTFSCLSQRNLLNWCVTIVKNKSIDQLRKQKMSLTAFDDVEAYIADDGEAPDEKIIRQESYQRLYIQLKSLDYRTRQILEMRYCADMSYKEIAQELGVTAKFIDNRIMSAKAKLRRLLESEETSDHEKQRK